MRSGIGADRASAAWQRKPTCASGRWSGPERVAICGAARVRPAPESGGGPPSPACSPDDIRPEPRRSKAGACYEDLAEPNEPEMQTTFSLAQLADPDVRESEKILRACVHCGFCTATCPTYVLLGDELDSPRGRIYLIKDMLENAKPASPRVVTHIDRCLSCLACMTTCPSGVHYMHLVDHARRYIEETYTRPWPDRLLRRMLARGAAAAAAVPPRAARLQARAPLPPSSPRASCRHDRARAGAPAAGLAGRPAAGVPGRRRAGRARGAALGLRPAGAGARDQRGDHPPPDPPRRRGGDRPRRRLLRCAGPPHGARGAGARLGQSQHRRLGAGACAGRPRCRDRQRLGLRHHGQGLRLHAARGFPAMPRRRRASPRSRGT